MTASLPGAVALVAGGTRGGGRGIAVELGAAGATVYVTGRSTRHGTSDLGRPETIEETAEQVDAAGGRGIAIRCDHSDPEQVEALVARIAREQGGGSTSSSTTSGAAIIWCAGVRCGCTRSATASRSCTARWTRT